MITDICVMQILLAAATAPEIQPTIDFLGTSDFRLGNNEIDILITGIGLVPTVHSLMKKVLVLRPGLVVQAGIAGCFARRLPGEVVVIKEEALDMGVWEAGGFHSLFDLGLVGADSRPFSGGLLVNPYKKLLHFSAIEQVRSISVNEITTHPDRIGWLQQNLSPVVESMEGAALHYVCLKETLPFLQIRSVSNAVGVRDKTKWDIPAAVRELNKKLIGFLNTLAGQDDTILEK
jgi:futalosine hydrolase